MRQSALDKAIENLEAKQADIRATADSQLQALAHAIALLRAQKVMKKASRPREVAPIIA